MFLFITTQHTLNMTDPRSVQNTCQNELSKVVGVWILLGSQIFYWWTFYLSQTLMNLNHIQRKLLVTVQCKCLQKKKLCCEIFFFLILWFCSCQSHSFCGLFLTGKKPVYSMKLKIKKTWSDREMEKYKYIVCFLCINWLNFIRSSFSVVWILPHCWLRDLK